jgi:hypothetical protein
VFQRLHTLEPTSIVAAVLTAVASFDVFGCFGNAEQTSVVDVDGARPGPGTACESIVDGRAAAATPGRDVGSLGAPGSADADPYAEHDRKYRLSIVKASSTAVRKALRAHAKHATKPDAETLARKLTKNDGSLRKKVEKAATKARENGLTPDIDAAAVVETTHGLVAAVLEIASGTPPVATGTAAVRR